MPDLDVTTSISVTGRIITPATSTIDGTLSNFNELTETNGVFVIAGANITGQPSTTLSFEFTANFDTSKSLVSSANTVVTQTI